MAVRKLITIGNAKAYLSLARDYSQIDTPIQWEQTVVGVGHHSKTKIMIR